jgi:hypothetical protein
VHWARHGQGSAAKGEARLRSKGRSVRCGFDLIYAENMGTMDCRFQLLILSVGTLLKITYWFYFLVPTLLWFLD